MKDKIEREIVDELDSCENCGYIKVMGRCSYKKCKSYNKYRGTLFYNVKDVVKAIKLTKQKTAQQIFDDIWKNITISITDLDNFEKIKKKHGGK